MASANDRAKTLGGEKGNRGMPDAVGLGLDRRPIRTFVGGGNAIEALSERRRQFHLRRILRWSSGQVNVAIEYHKRGQGARAIFGAAEIRGKDGAPPVESAPVQVHGCGRESPPAKSQPARGANNGGRLGRGDFANPTNPVWEGAASRAVKPAVGCPKLAVETFG